jgi:Fe-S cluster assembly protein SufD
MNHICDQTDFEKAQHIQLTRIAQQSDSFYHNDTLTWSGSLVRNNLEAIHKGQNIETVYKGLYIADSDQLIDNHTLVDHAMPHCESNEQYKGILSSNGKAVFNGKVMVRQDAQKTNAYQSNNNILLSDKALVNAKPQLEIFADDVKCSHGATVGQLDTTSLFYLKARGISENVAKSLLIQAFAGEIIDQCSITSAVDYFHESLISKLSQIHGE